MHGVTLSASGDGQYRLQQGTAEGKLDKLNVDIIAGNTKYKFNGKTLLARIVGRVAHTSQNIVCASIDWFESVFKLRENTSLCSC